jgi:hypothetical protein
VSKANTALSFTQRFGDDPMDHRLNQLSAASLIAVCGRVVMDLAICSAEIVD